MALSVSRVPGQVSPLSREALAEGRGVLQIYMIPAQW